ncbi:MAG: PIN domain-containing protein [Candidatus Helarchaeota archaeon]
MSGQKRYALDSSILIQYFYLKDKKTKFLITNGITNLVALSECYYIICRKEGNEVSMNYIDELSSLVKIIPSEQIIKIAGQFKCKFPIALADCWTLATAFVLDTKAIFAFKEKELIDNLNDILKEVKIEFFENLNLS